MTRIVFIVVCFLFITRFAFADFVVEVGNGDGSGFFDGSPAFTVVQGTHDDMVISVYGYAPADSPITEQFGEYDLAFEFGGDGFGVPMGFSNFRVAWGNDGFGNPADLSLDQTTAPGIFSGSSGSLVPNFDFIVSDSNGSDFDFAPLAGLDEPVHLFDLAFNIDPNAAVGDYAFSFIVETQPPGVNFTDIPGLAGSLTGINGSFRITAVPEPTSLALMGAGLAGFVGSRRLKKRRAAAAKVAADAAS